MVDSTVLRGTPFHIQQGIDDQSRREQAITTINLPQHLPFIPIYSPYGPEDHNLVNAASLFRLYGNDVFDVTKPWYNHSSVFAEALVKANAGIIVKRILPDDVGPEANLTIWLDLIPTQVPLYDRNADGTFDLDVNGNKKVTQDGDGHDVTVAGYKGKILVTTESDLQAFNTSWGTLTQSQGSITISNTHSTKYPIAQLKVPFKGTPGNNVGVRISAPTVATQMAALPQQILDNENSYPFVFTFIKRPNATTTPSIVKTKYQDNSVVATFNPDSIDPNTSSSVYAGNTVINNYQSLGDNPLSNVYGPFGDLYIYQSQIDTVLGLLAAAEVAAIETNELWHDVTDVSKKYKYNFISGSNFSGIPYKTFVLLTSGEVGGEGSVQLTNKTNLWAGGASNGSFNTLVNNIPAFDVKVGEILDEFIDPDSIYNIMATNPMSHFWDSGYVNSIKYKIPKVISVRKDTFVGLSTVTAQNTQNPTYLTLTQEESIAANLQGKCRLYMESEEFGTKTCRAIIVMDEGDYIGDTRNNRTTPQLLEIALKTANLAGASDGNWNKREFFDSEPGNSVKYFTRLKRAKLLRKSIKDTLWGDSVIWSENFDITKNYFPHLKTCYTDDSSVVNSYINVLAAANLEKVLDLTHKSFTGSTGLSDAQFIERVSTFIKANTKPEKYGNRFTIVPRVSVTEADKQRGFSWTVVIDFYAGSMRTVQISLIRAYSINDLPTQQ